MGVGILDVDSFKAVNDVHGHAAGDAVLVEVARRLLQRTRREDILGRWGGEEFVVLAPDTDGQGMARLAERMREAVAATPFAVDGRPLVVTVSAGWSVAPGGVGLEELVRVADLGLYAAKANGRNAVRPGAASADPAPGDGAEPPGPGR